jgi:hypothetical protein
MCSGIINVMCLNAFKVGEFLNILAVAKLVYFAESANDITTPFQRVNDGTVFFKAETKRKKKRCFGSGEYSGISSNMTVYHSVLRKKSNLPACHVHWAASL